MTGRPGNPSNILRFEMRLLTSILVRAIEIGNSMVRARNKVDFYIYKYL